MQWNLKINPQKCETIFFHQLLRFLGIKNRQLIKNFKIKIADDNNHPIENKKSVRYLGVTIDYLVRLSQHVNIQLDKARKCLNGYKNIFFN